MIKSLPKYGVILTLAALAYIFLAPRFDIGIFGDDARDILAAQSLTTGRYVQLSVPGQPATNFPLPGFPLLLTPFVLLFAPAWAWLQGVPILCTLGAAGLLFRLARSRLSPLTSLIVLALFVFNPTTLALSSRVIADSFFLLLVLAAFLSWERFLNGKKGRDFYLTAALTGVSAVTRPEGGLLILAIVFVLAFQKEWRRLLLFFLLAVAPLGLVLLRNHLVLGALTGYASLWESLLPALSDPVHVLRHGARLLRTLFLDVTLGVSSEEMSSAVQWGGIVLLIFGMIFLLLRGHQQLAQKNKRSAAWVLTAGLFIGSYILLHTAWLAMDPHYLWPLLPILLLFTAAGIQNLPGHTRWIHGGTSLFLLGTLGVYLWQGAFALRQTLHRPITHQTPQLTLGWIKKTLQDTAFILTPRAQMVYLHTRRYATAFIPAQDAEEFRYQLLRSSITHVLTQPVSVLHVDTLNRHDPIWVWQHTPRWISQSPQGFEKIFSDPTEKTELYALRPAASFQKAYATYLQGRAAMNQGQTDLAMATFRFASTIDPMLVSALNAYGIACLYTGQHLSEGETQLKRAVRLQPDHPISWLTLARLYRRQGKQDLARHAYQQTEQALIKIGDTGPLLELIKQENSPL